MNFRVFDSLADLTSAAAAELLRRVDAGASVIALSGGTTPQTLYQRLGERENHERLSRQPLIWVLEDERFVPPDHEDSNSRMIEHSLFKAGLPASHRFLRFRTGLGDPHAAAQDFEDQWNEARIDRLDVAILGMGEDGHTASLFPGTDILEVTGRIAAAVEVEKLSTWRISLTLPILRAATTKYVLVSGSSKREALQRASRGEDLPIVRVAEGAGTTWWMVDRAAYGEPT